MGKSRKQLERIASPLSLETVIHVVRGRRVILDADLASIYGVPTKTLNQAFKRNIERFPEDFAFQLSRLELENWRSQIVTSNPSAKMALRRCPYAFTQEGIAMLSSVLRSERAIRMNIEIMRAFVRLRELMVVHKDIAARVENWSGASGEPFRLLKFSRRISIAWAGRWNISSLAIRHTAAIASGT